MELLVCKFGGSSVASSEKMERIVEIIRNDNRRRCIVLSAPGKSPEYKIKITDLLIDASQKALKGLPFDEIITGIKKRFHSIYDPLLLSAETIDDILSDIDKRLQFSKDHPGKFRDLVVAAGENINCQLFARYLSATGITAQYINPRDAGMVVSPVFGDAQPLPECTLKMAALKKTCADTIIVFPGFFGYTAEGDVATFSRGGSDLTGSLLAETLVISPYKRICKVPIRYVYDHSARHLVDSCFHYSSPSS